MATRPGGEGPNGPLGQPCPYPHPDIGTWRSMAARSVRDAEVVGSNPTVPTQEPRAARKGGPLVWGPIPSRVHRARRGVDRREWGTSGRDGQRCGDPRPNITLLVIDALRYACGVLRSFADKETERVWDRQQSRIFGPDLQRAAYRKLLLLDAAEVLADLRVPPGNRLEKLHGDREGQHSIRINQQWRVCFRWTLSGPEDVEIVDYH